MQSDTRERRWRLVEHLEARRRGASAAELAAALGVSARTVYRDLKSLGRAGLPLGPEREGATTRWRLEVPPPAAPTPAPTLAEAVAVAAAANGLGPSVPYAAALAEAVARLRAALPGVDVVALAEALANPSEADGTDAQERHLASVLEALQTGRLLHLRYQGLGRRRPVDLDVFAVGLRRHIHGLLLVAEDPDGTPRALRVDRIRALTPGEARRPPPVEHDLEGGFRESLGLVAGGPPLALRLEVSAAAAEVLAGTPFHPTQRLARRADGSALVELTVTDTPELRGFIRAFGPAMTVLEPDPLARDLAAEAAAVHRTYARRLDLAPPGRRPVRGPARGRVAGEAGRGAGEAGRPGVPDPGSESDSDV